LFSNFANIVKNSSEIVWNACCKIKKEILSDLDAFLSAKNFIACLTSLKVINFYVIVSESSDFKAVTVRFWRWWKHSL